mmetsp:Transcript_9178/g.18052  ORF Transcript_9178/g.18052 Transcript_9178/m.18052 type:complete len:227 (-) Transcript_9178:155-835(-)|eukprot:CAMPEP_0171529596 /NCGR_PEP_ID=MMETSP0959-20130129/12458_1 /TAXON_ID=87120 /ORGANISM="Aurantiochytrium limacinum, Strain ATCCMYA-1381" /LENGTH=226 /DNA_ID=CAMNT_0012071991 /DNA_START=31 /DNA_END=711 /DNA_ORIENTATION=+
MANSDQNNDLKTMKRALRRQVNAVLKGMARDHLNAASKQLGENAVKIPQALEAKRVCIYLAMKNEAQTDVILDWAFGAEKRVFVPKVTGMGSEDMVMPELMSLEELASLERMEPWGIPEFRLDQLVDRPDGFNSTPDDLIDVVFTPGVAFTKDGFRCGHGRGYYDCFLKKLQKSRKEAGMPPAYTIGIALDEQMVDSVPVEDHDVALDAVATPSGVYFSADFPRTK